MSRRVEARMDTDETPVEGQDDVITIDSDADDTTEETPGGTTPGT